MKERGKNESFESLETTDLASLLHSFYAEVRDKAGKRYGQSTYRGIRAALNRHLRMPPHNRMLDIVQDKEFTSANYVFDGYVKANIKEGNATTVYKIPLSDADWQKLFASDVLDKDTPQGLQNKVFVNIMTHFARCGREGLRDLKKTVSQ